MTIDSLVCAVSNLRAVLGTGDWGLGMRFRLEQQAKSRTLAKGMFYITRGVGIAHQNSRVKREAIQQIEERCRIAGRYGRHSAELIHNKRGPCTAGL